MVVDGWAKVLYTGYRFMFSTSMAAAFALLLGN
jgi:hypothetical protein